MILRRTVPADASSPEGIPVRRSILLLFRRTMDLWLESQVPKLAAALSFYTAFAIAPLLVIAIAVAARFFGENAAHGEVVRQITKVVGADMSRIVQDVLEHAWRQPHAGLWATTLCLAAFVVASSGVFGELQDSLNRIWRVRKRPGRGIVESIMDRFWSFSMVLGSGFLLLISLVASTFLQTFGRFLLARPGSSVILHVENFLTSVALMTVLFGSVFKLVPDARTRLRDIWIGAGITGLLFTTGRFLIGLYLQASTLGSTYGKAGSFVVFLLWINYSAQIVFFGAAFTKSYADLYGIPPVPRTGAESIGSPPLASPEDDQGPSALQVGAISGGRQGSAPRARGAGAP
jgi:membrane protein